MYEGAREKHLPFYILKKFIDVQMIYNVLISAVQQSDSVIYIYIYIYTHTHTHILFHILFHYGLSQVIKYSSLCYTVGPCLSTVLTSKTQVNFVVGNIGIFGH